MKHPLCSHNKKGSTSFSCFSYLSSFSCASRKMYFLPALLLMAALLLSGCASQETKDTSEKDEKPAQFIRTAYVGDSPELVYVRFRLFLSARLQKPGPWFISSMEEQKAHISKILSVSNVRSHGRASGLYVARVNPPLNPKQQYLLKVGKLKPVQILQKRPRQVPFKATVDEYTTRDTSNPPPSNPTLFIGSSSFRLWSRLEEDMQQFRPMNRGFGGAQIEHVIYYMPRIVFPYEPERVVFYCGENDIAVGKSPKTVFQDFLEFCRKLREQQPETPVYYSSMKPSPKRWHLWGKFQKGNAMISNYCRTNENSIYVDVSTPMLASDGKPREDIWKEDKLHMNRKGYTEIWIPVLKKALTRD